MEITHAALIALVLTPIALFAGQALVVAILVCALSCQAALLGDAEPLNRLLAHVGAKKEGGDADDTARTKTS